jgi:hypothetical protein
MIIVVSRMNGNLKLMLPSTDRYPGRDVRLELGAYC